MTHKEILLLAKLAHKQAKTRDFREQVQPLELWMGAVFINFYHLAVLAERKKCEELCTEQGKLIGSTGTTCAAAIRARGEQE